MVASSILLGAVFIAIGYLISSLVRERATAAGIAIGVWLAFVVLYDMALLGLLVVDQGRNISSSTLNMLLLANPTDVYRMLTLAGTAGVSAFAGMAASERDDLGSDCARRRPLDLDLVAAVACRARLLAEGTMIRLAPLLIIAATVGGCGPKTAAPTPPPFPLTQQATGPLLRHEPPRT